MGRGPSSPVSELLLHWGNGDRKALEAILPLVYNQLRLLARYYLRQQRANHTLQTTALVHEAYLRLAQEKSPHVENRAHFLGIAAQLMRWILVDYERNRRAAKRGAGATRLTLDPSIAARSQGADFDLLALDAFCSHKKPQVDILPLCKFKPLNHKGLPRAKSAAALLDACLAQLSAMH